MNHVKIFKGLPLRFALWYSVHNWFKKIPPDHFGQAEMKKPIGSSNKTSTAQSSAEDQILEHPIQNQKNKTCIER